MPPSPSSRLPYTFQLDPEQMAQSQAISLLRDAILTGGLRPGTRLSEQEIATAMGISRQPVREAFVRLSGEGLLEVLPQRGTFVTRISAHDVLDARFMREAVEADLARLAAKNTSPALIGELEKNLAAQRRHVGDAAKFLKLDEAFHRLIARAAGMASTWDYLQRLKSQIDRVRYLAREALPAAALITHHEHITQTIASGNPTAAEAAMRRHLSQILEDLPQVRAAYPDCFTASETEA